MQPMLSWAAKALGHTCIHTLDCSNTAAGFGFEVLAKHSLKICDHSMKSKGCVMQEVGFQRIAELQLVPFGC